MTTQIQTLIKQLTKRGEPMADNSVSVQPLSHWHQNATVQSGLLLVAFAFIGFVLIPDPAAWMTLTIAGLAMGMMLFVMTSGFTLVFGLMDVLNFGHGAFISFGAFVGFSVMAMFPELIAAGSFWTHIGLFVLAMMGAAVVVGLLSWAFERLIIRHVYGNHLMQILITTGGMIVAEEMIYVLWGHEERAWLKPDSFQGSFQFGDFVFEKYRLLAVIMGVVLFILLRWVFTHTRLGLLIRAGVENREIVKSLGFNIEKLFILVFIAGSALAGMGGVMWGLYDEVITAHIGQNLMITVFIVAIIGGLGSIEGCFLAALMVGLLTNYVGFIFPKLALVSTLILMVAVLLWRPKGLVPVSKGDS
ncbi:branched-chain amino acid ABC transporter permease [Reinekea blandensis]|uniref:Branched-chain amino acid ABC transporter, permease protein n=1 Tax=Reinekea blandensis MED297 TaxID=314283 RepID=A4BDV3_9GAMM|nr:branched-chain amino acid ABC transporter permease [Reinekea blandensis]EAR09712.1 branched-chain amino acid ABC transporter, permease protein [Reinekea blandensis MED297]